MSYWHLLTISAAMIAFAILLYLLLHWRKAFRAMLVVATAGLAAGVLLGLWSMRMLDEWTHTDARDAESTPGVRIGAATSIPPSRTPVSEVTPIGSGATVAVASHGTNPILGSYVGQALAQRYAKKRAPGASYEWPQIEQGCRLGNYEPTSLLCQAELLAVYGWGDRNSVSYEYVAGFCHAGHLEEDTAPCLTVRRRSDRPVDSTTGK